MEKKLFLSLFYLHNIVFIKRNYCIHFFNETLIENYYLNFMHLNKLGYIWRGVQKMQKSVTYDLNGPSIVIKISYRLWRWSTEVVDTIASLGNIVIADSNAVEKMSHLY
jgi:hypothetical protein